MAIIQRGALEVVIASYTGTGANLNLDLGFIPAYANGVDITSGMGQWWWNSGFSSATSVASQAVWGVIATAGSNATFATLAAGTGGFLVLDGSTGSGIGLVVGTDTTTNISGHNYVVTAWQLH